MVVYQYHHKVIKITVAYSLSFLLHQTLLYFSDALNFSRTLLVPLHVSTNYKADILIFISQLTFFETMLLCFWMCYFPHGYTEGKPTPFLVSRHQRKKVRAAHSNELNSLFILNCMDQCFGTTCLLQDKSQ